MLRLRRFIGSFNPRRNHRIEAENVRLVDETGKMVGLKPLDEAIDAAKCKGMDLVEVKAGTGEFEDAPTCRLMPRQSTGGGNRPRAASKTSAASTSAASTSAATAGGAAAGGAAAGGSGKRVKEVRFGANIAEHDVQFKVARLEEFLSKAHPVKVSIVFKRRVDRELAQQMVLNIFERVEELVVENAKIIQFNRSGREFSTVLHPKDATPLQ